METTNKLNGCTSRFSWGAILAGTVMILAIQVLLSFLGIGIGACIGHIKIDLSVSRGFCIGMGIWLFLLNLLSFGVGGIVASRLAQIEKRGQGFLHGLVTWGITSLLLLWLITTSLGSVINGKIPLVSSGLKMAVSRIEKNLFSREDSSKKNVLDTIKTEAKTLFRQAQTKLSSLTMPSEGDGIALIERFLTSQETGSSSVTREEVWQLLTSRANLNQEQAETTISRWEQTYQNSKTNAWQVMQNAMDKATQGLANIAWGFFLMLLVGAIAGGVGGILGASSNKRNLQNT